MKSSLMLELVSNGSPRAKNAAPAANMTISLAFLAPDLVKAAIEGRLPRGIRVARLCDAPADWSRQYRMLRPCMPLAGVSLTQRTDSARSSAASCVSQFTSTAA